MIDAREDRTAKDPESVITTNAKHAYSNHPNGPCEATWGNCNPERPVYWGKPSKTPHRCAGPRKHLYRLHVCERCNIIGGHVTPSPYSKAGAQLRAATIAHHKQMEVAK